MKQHSDSSGRFVLWQADCREALARLDDNSVDSIVTDPPYELGFMGKTWDASGIAYDVDLWREALRVLKPGGHLLAFGGSRTYHRLACAVEDAGFEIRDQIMWVYGSGFPKSLNVAKALEAHITTGSSNKTQFKNLPGEKIKRGDWGIAKQQYEHGQRDTNYDETAGDTRLGELEPTTDAAKQWNGWGTALKPAHEPIVVARKPFEGTVAANVLKWGTGALNIDGTRVGDEVRKNNFNDFSNQHGNKFGNGRPIAKLGESEVVGRWPANFIHDGSEEVVTLFPDTGKSTGGRIGKKSMGAVTNVPAGQYEAGDPGYGDSGSAARFFYCAKASKAERNAGLGHLQAQQPVGGADKWTEQDRRKGQGVTRQPSQNHHPTVKPIALMRYLIRLVTPPGGVVLDPFAGSGTTMVAALMEGVTPWGCEMTEDYVPIILGRIQWALDEKPTDTLFSA